MRCGAPALGPPIVSISEAAEECIKTYDATAPGTILIQTDGSDKNGYRCAAAIAPNLSNTLHLHKVYDIHGRGYSVEYSSTIGQRR